MTADMDIFRRASFDNEKDEQARRAVKAFMKMLPTLNAYVRVLTKNSAARIEMAARDNGSTDGKKIFYRPPIALGDNTPHDRRLCDKRDDTKQLLCAACARREDVLVTIYHEIAHIAYDSFAKTSEEDRTRVVAEAVREAGGKYAEAIARKIEAAPEYVKRSYMGLCKLVSPFLPFIFNCLEDARVNRELFKARKGTKTMFEAQVSRIFAEGVEQRDEFGNLVVKMWNEYPLNMQVSVGLFCKASGYDYKGWFAGQVEEALDDEELSALVRRLDTVRSAAGVYNLGFPVLKRLRELGFCKSEEDPVDDPEPEEEENNEPQPEGVSPEKSEETSDEGEESDEESSSGGGDPQESGDSSGSDSPDSDSVDAGGEEDGSEGVDAPGEGDSSEGDSEADDARAGSSEGSSDEADGGSSDASEEGVDDSSDASTGSESEPEAGSSSDGGDSDSGSEYDGEDDEDFGDGTGESSDTGRSDSGSSGEDMEPGDSEGITGTGDISGEREVDDREERDASGETEDRSPVSGGRSDGDSISEPSVDEDGSLDADDLSREAGSEHSEGSPVDDDEVPGESDRDHHDSGEHGEDADSSRGQPRGDDDEVSRGEDGNGSDSGGGGDGGDEAEAIDTGADSGRGGVEVVENEKNDDIPWGDAEDCRAGLVKFGDHEEKPHKAQEAEARDHEAVDRAIIQGIYFETPSRTIFGVREHKYGEPIYVGSYNTSKAWNNERYARLGYSRRELGIEGDFHAPEGVLGPALLRMRVAFSDNQRGKDIRNQKSGKVDGRLLGRRAFHNDERLFRKRILPGKKDYFVLIGMDVSGSTVGVNIQLEKRAVMAQATLLDRMGIKFALYAHSGDWHNPGSGRGSGIDLDMYLIKEPNEPWTPQTEQRLLEIGPDSANLDGHSLEYYRKVLDRRTETDKIILYYTDGKMPAENHDEELEILQREIRICKQKGYTLLGVGIRTDSPVRHGLDTVQVDGDDDIVRVVKHLEKRLLAG